MNVFLVDAGKLFHLDTNVISKRVQDLQFLLSDLADIPLDKQVLLTGDGRSLDSTQQLYHYVSSFSHDRPVFLFSKSNIECHVVQPSSALPPDPNLQDRLERYLNDQQTCETLKNGADLANAYQNYSEDILKRTRQLVQDQQLQRQGWAAVIKNLDQVTAGFEKRVTIFHDLYDSFLKNKDNYSIMLQRFEEDCKILSQIPLTKGITDQLRESKMIDSIRYSKQQGLETLRSPGLGITDSMRAPDPGASPHEGLQTPLTMDANKSEFFSLLNWIEAQDSQNSLNSLVVQCSRAMDQISLSFLPRVQEDVDKVKQSLHAPGMRDIKGLEERLAQLQTLLLQTEKICDEQANNANTIRNQQESFMVQGDISVLAELHEMHRSQLKRLHNNNRNLIEFYNKFAAAKGELSQNLLIRLNWVTHCQKAIWNCDGRLTMISENLVRVKRRFAILEQINIAPELYCKCLGEVSRRGVFTRRYKHWGRDLKTKVGKERLGECEKRGDFHEQLTGHFLTTLFRSLDSVPTDFAAQDALSFDEELFEVTEEELLNLAELFPVYASTLLPSSGPAEDSVLYLNPPTESDLGPDSKEPEPRRVEKSDQELSKQFNKSMQLELDLDCLREQNKKLADSNKELEEKFLAAQGRVEQLSKSKAEKLADAQQEIERVSQDCETFRKLACEKDAKFSALKVEQDTSKLTLRGLKMDKEKVVAQLEEIKGQVKQRDKALVEREEKMQCLQRDLDLVTSDQTEKEQHRQQLNNLKQEIERAKDKEKNFELEKLRLEKDKIIEELERKYKLDLGEWEKIRNDQVQELSDTNSKLEARLQALQTEVETLQSKLQLEQETMYMYKAEAERDLKIQKQNAAVELDELKLKFSKREGNFTGDLAALQEKLSLTQTDGVSAGPSTAVRNESEAEEMIKKLQEEVEKLAARKARSLQISVTQFQKGDTVFFYYDENKNNFLIANVSPNEYQYFLHPDNLGALGLSLDTPHLKPWSIGIIKDKEFCQARKVNNRFRVPEGRKFYRVYAQPRTLGPDHPPAPGRADAPD